MRIKDVLSLAVNASSAKPAAEPFVRLEWRNVGWLSESSIHHADKAAQSVWIKAAGIVNHERQPARQRADQAWAHRRCVTLGSAMGPIET